MPFFAFTQSFIINLFNVCHSAFSRLVKRNVIISNKRYTMIKKIVFDTKANRILNVFLGILLSTIYIWGGYQIDWHRVSDPIANWIYFYLFMPFSISLSLIALLVTFHKSERLFLRYTRLSLNVFIIMAISIWFLNWTFWLK